MECKTRSQKACRSRGRKSRKSEGCRGYVKLDSPEGYSSAYQKGLSFHSQLIIWNDANTLHFWYLAIIATIFWRQQSLRTPFRHLSGHKSQWGTDSSWITGIRSRCRKYMGQSSKAHWRHEWYDHFHKCRCHKDAQTFHSTEEWTTRGHKNCYGLNYENDNDIVWRTCMIMPFPGTSLNEKSEDTPIFDSALISLADDLLITDSLRRVFVPWW